MSWLFSRALVAEYSEGALSDTEQCALWKSTPTQRPHWLQGRTTGLSNLSRSGMTYVPLTDAHGAALLTSFLEASRAKTSALRARVPDWLENAVVCGESSPASSAKSSRRGSSSKTAPSCEQGDLTSCSKTLPGWGMMRRGVCSVHPMWVPPIFASVRGWWPTPCASEGRDCGSRWERLIPLDKGGRIQRRMASLGLPETRQTTKATLNPSWVEWLMGWPVGWTVLQPSGTDKYQQWLRLQGLS